MKPRKMPELDGRALINGKRISTGKKMDVLSPSTGKKIGEISVCGIIEVNDAVAAARKAFPEWSAMGIRNRIEILKKARKALLEEFHDLAATETLETGKPYAMSEMGPLYALLTLDYYCKNAERFLEDEEIRASIIETTILMPRRTCRTFYPRGVVAIIVPWNFPVMMGMLSLIPALCAGNTVVLKASSHAAFTGSRMVEILNKAGLPKGVLNLVQGQGMETGEILTKSDVDMVVFTGSSEAGRKVAANCSQRFCPCVLELSGLDAMIVLQDANLEEAANGALFGSFMNSGQTCVASKRVFVQKKIAKRFVEMVIEKTRRLKTGDGFEQNDIGPLISARRIGTVERFVNDAVEKGAKIETGGKRLKGPGFFFQPTVLTRVKEDMLIMREEPFGPIMPIMEFDDEEEAVALANSTSYGLGGSVWSKDIGRAERIARRIEAGTVWINAVSLPFVNAPFGGVKRSGLLKEGGKEGIRGMCNERIVSVNRFSSDSRLWWFPFDRKLEERLEKVARGMYEKDFFKRSKNLLGLAKTMFKRG